jgi:acetoin utilization deacetylase AcuC-like enzyme
LRAIHRAVGLDQELFHQVQHHEARHATMEELLLCHDAEYVNTVSELAKSGGGLLDSDTVVSSGTWSAATASVGGVLDAVDMALDGRARRSFCAVRPPGHHALRRNGMGFCIFGSVAIGAHYARGQHGLERILIVDWDVHHGNGTEALILDEPDIHFVSMHQWPWYPGSGGAADRGKGNVWNVPLPAGLPPVRYVDSLLRAVDAAAHGFTPDLILVSSGFDSMRGDPLGGFTLESSDFGRMTRELCARAEAWCNGRVVSSLEGGYNVATLGGAATTHMRALAGLSTPATEADTT